MTQTIQITPGVTPHWSGDGYTVYYPPAPLPLVHVYHDHDGEHVALDTGGERLIPEAGSGYRVEWGRAEARAS